MKIRYNLCILFGLVLLLSACSGNELSTNSVGDSGAVSWEGMTMIEANAYSLSNDRKSKYRMDAEKLAVRYINNRDSTQTDIPEALIKLFYNGLIHIVNADHPEAQEATDPEYQVHARTPADPRAITVRVDTTAPWIDAWRDSTTQTDNEEIDELLNQFDLSLLKYYELESSSLAVAKLQSEYAINGYAVGRLFMQVDDISSAGPPVVTDGSNIEVLMFDDHLRYKFNYRFGDCPAGCINEHTWTFNVYVDGNVEFVSESGNSLP